ncbi:MAG: baseplate J/gp47 family protein [Alphaproteobacteria bacterium]|nr:baseplate J/gp47 family protein [Alphaproteobacteria bacterium]
MQTATNEDFKKFLSLDYIDLSALPPPKIIEELDFEVIFQELLADFKWRKPNYNALLESDPIIIALECAAYRELLLRNRINEMAKATMMAYAIGTDLDNLVAFYGIKRQEGELDDRLRYRALLSLASLTTAGSEKSYLFHALSASSKVKSVSVRSPDKGKVLLTLLSMEGNGIADEELIKIVTDYLSAEDKRPLTDEITVQSAEIIPFTVQAKMFVHAGPSASITQEEFNANLQTYLNKQHNIGSVVAVSGIFDALHSEGVQKVQLLAPEADIITNKEQAAFCTEINLEVEVINDRT